MKCFRCLVEYQRIKRESVSEAEYIYSGESLCREHINTVRGNLANFDRYAPEETP